MLREREKNDLFFKHVISTQKKLHRSKCKKVEEVGGKVNKNEPKMSVKQGKMSQILLEISHNREMNKNWVKHE